MKELENVTEGIYRNLIPEIPTLYHYTSQENFLKLFYSKSLWFTDLQYLNDSQEYDYAIGKIKEIILENYNSELFRDNFSFYSKPIYTFSFTEKRDSLSQWRGYCSNGGIAFSLYKDHLDTLIKSNNIYLSKCYYDKDDIMQLVIEKIIGSTPEKFYEMRDSPYRGSKFGHIYEDIAYRIRQYAPLIKHPAFMDEKEWRIVADSLNRNDFKRLYRSGNSNIIPYVNMSFNVEHLGIQEIVISPTYNKELAHKSLKDFMAFNTGGLVENSKIPYRNW